MENQEILKELCVKLNEEEYDFFKTISISKLLKTENGLFLQGTQTSFGIILEDLTHLLTDKGFDSDDNPNEFGAQIEHLIDIINRAIYP